MQNARIQMLKYGMTTSFMTKHTHFLYAFSDFICVYMTLYEHLFPPFPTIPKLCAHCAACLRRFETLKKTVLDFQIMSQPNNIIDFVYF
jgi:hypothetical protein